MGNIPLDIEIEPVVINLVSKFSDRNLMRLKHLIRMLLDRGVKVHFQCDRWAWRETNPTVYQLFKFIPSCHKVTFEEAGNTNTGMYELAKCMNEEDLSSLKLISFVGSDISDESLIPVLQYLPFIEKVLLHNAQYVTKKTFKAMCDMMKIMVENDEEILMKRITVNDEKLEKKVQKLFKAFPGIEVKFSIKDWS